jgi:hypothetical protein
VIAVLCALLAALAAGSGVVVLDRLWRRHRTRQAARRARIVQTVDCDRDTDQ